MRGIFSILLLFALTVGTVDAQKIVTLADKHYDKKEYMQAIDLYKEALNKVNKKLVKQHIYYRIANAYRLTFQIEKAAEYFDFALKLGYDMPEFYLNYGQVFLMLGEYKEAKEFLGIYLETNPDDEVAKNYEKSCRYALKYSEPDPDMQVKNEISLNSRYGEFGLAKVDDRLFFASSRIGQDSSNIYEVTGQGYTDFYLADYDKKQKLWGLPSKLNSSINSNYNDGTATFDDSTNTLYFMQCNGLNGKSYTCNIYSSTLNKLNNTWTQPEIFQFHSDEYNYGHPSISDDGQTLYFTSDMPGGQGGKDLWMVKKRGETLWGDPENLGTRINTAGDEVFPYMYKDTLLYFSSNGHVGFGGLDIFASVKTDRGFNKPENLNKPINSSADDFGIVAFKTDSGLFCSNRFGGMGDDDIYSFFVEHEIVAISGVVEDHQSNEPISDATVFLSGSDNSVDSTKSNQSGQYEFQNAKTGTDYAIAVHKEGYLGDIQLVVPKEMIEKTDSNLTVSPGTEQTTKKTILPEVKFNMIKATNEEIKLNNIYYDFGKWNITNESKKELNRLVNILRVNPDIKIMINSHTDIIGNAAFNQQLSEYRAQSVVNYLIEKGIDPERLSSKGWGETKPVVTDAELDIEHQQNRRTTFQITNLNEVEFGYKPAVYKDLANRIITEKKEEEKEQEEIALNGEKVVFRLQIYAGKRNISKSYKNDVEDLITPYRIIRQKGNDGMYRYMVGDFNSFSNVIEIQEILKSNNFSSFVLAYLNGMRITVLEARQLTESDYVSND